MAPSPSSAARGEPADPAAGELVRTAFGAYQLDPNVTVDVLEAATLVERAEQALQDDPAAAAVAAREAAHVLAQPLLAGLDSEWVDRERQRLVPVRARAHLASSAAATALGDHVTAVDAARAAVGVRPVRRGGPPAVDDGARRGR